jgi:myo-inositol catabolism protein IolC
MFLLPLDRRAPWPRGAIAAAKQAVYEGFVKAVTGAGLPPNHGGVIVDEQSGALILRDACARGFVTACAIKQVTEPGFDGADDIAEAHLDRCDATYWRVVVRYNPEGDPGANASQADWVRRLCDALRRRAGPRLMCDLVLLPTQQQIALGIRAYDRDLLPGLTRRAMTELMDAGVEPDVWIIEGFERCDDYARVMEVVAARGPRIGCLVRAAGHGSDSTRERMAAGLSVPGVVGVVLGPQQFWEPASSWVCGGTSRTAAVATVASEFQTWIAQLAVAS